MNRVLAGFDFASPTQSGDGYWDYNSGPVGRQTVQKRTGTASCDAGVGSLGKIFSDHPTTLITGAAWYLGGLNTTVLEFFDDANNRHLSITVDNDGTLRVRRGTGSGTILGSSSPGLIVTNAWEYIEVKATINDTTGAVEVRVNGVTRINLTNVDTANSANVYIGAIRWSNGYIDDLYVNDTTGPRNNDFMGDIRVETLFVNAAGDVTQWTPSAGSNYQNVDDPTPDEDSTYNESANVGDQDLYNLDSLVTSSGSIKSVQVMARMRKTDAGTREACLITKSGSTTTEGDTEALSTSYVTYRSLLEINPDTGNPWTIAEVNALQAGAKVKS